MTEFLAPDLIEPIVGYKVFKHADDRKPLEGWADPWPFDAPLRARCRRRGKRSCGNCPCPAGRWASHDGHGCGIYAYRDIETLASERWIDGDDTTVRVALWGKVYEHEHGYRAEWGQITGVFCVEGTGRRAAANYGVPLLPWDLDPARNLELIVARRSQRRNEYQRRARAAKNGGRL